MTDDDFNAWRNTPAVGLKKLFKEKDKVVDCYGNMKVKQEE